MIQAKTNLVEYHVWDRTTRIFHWINALCVFSLICVGTVILFASDLGMHNDGKIALKTTHVYIGYVFVINLLWRLIWGFIGGHYARWTRVLPGGKGFGRNLHSYVKSLVHNQPDTFVGHNPLGRIAVTVILLGLVVQGGTGLVLAGTDVYMPPFGNYFAEWVAGPELDPTQVRPYAPETVDEQYYDSMRAFRAPVIATHETMYYLLLLLIAMHIAAVIFAENRSGGALISAMVTGKKILPEISDAANDKVQEATEN